MLDRDMTPAQKEYRRFDKHRGHIVITLVVFLVAALICFGRSLSIVDENPIPLLLFTCILIVLTILTIFICRYLARKGEQLYVAAYGNDKDIIRNGLFGELWQEFEWNSYEGLTDGKVVFAETHNNTIEFIGNVVSLVFKVKDLSDIGYVFSYYCTLVDALSMHQQYENERRLLAWAKAQRGYAFFAFIPTLVGGAVTIAHLVDEATALKDIEEWEKRQGE